MRQPPGICALALAFLLLPGPLAAQTSREEGEGIGPILRDFLDGLGPGLEALRERLGELGQYEPPEVLPNGDILIRRKRQPPAPEPGPDSAPEPLPDGQIEL